MNRAANLSPSGVWDNVLDSAFRIPHDNPPRWLLMITAYVDESGQEQGDWMCVAGFMANDDTWKTFRPEWKDAIYPRQHLHMKRLRFNRESERLMLEKAAEATKHCGLIPVFGSCRFSDFGDMVEGTGQERILSSYVMCCTALVLKVLIDLPAGERFEVVFEQQDRYEHYANVAMRTISQAPELRMPDGRGKLANWRFIPKQSPLGENAETCLTEPGDYLAYAFRQMWRNRDSRKSQWCMPILAAHNYEGVGAKMERATIRQIIADAGTLLAAEEPKGNS